MILDQYLKPNALYNKLLEKYRKHGRLIVATDFDCTLYDSKQIGESYDMVRQLIRDLYAVNCYIIVWTGNKDHEFVKSFMALHNIPYHSINEDAPFVSEKHLSRKIYANVFIDDRAGLMKVYDDLQNFLKEIKTW